jgi:putative hydrolases of HD superfamily
MADDGMNSVANFLFETGTLKNHKRTGWWIAGVKDPESVAEHSWRAALLASIIAELEGADPAKGVPGSGSGIPRPGGT